MRTPDEIIDSILLKRGVADRAEFFSDKPRVTHDPFLLHDMEEGADVVHRHIAEGKNVCVYGDYDVDGLMSVVLLTGFLESLPDAGRGRVSWYVPSRFGEGYGLNADALRRIREDGTDLIITVDCGIAPASDIEDAVSAGMAVVVTDHHDPDAESMPAAPSIDPKIPGSAYPFTGLCGCGVAFKLAQAIRTKYYPGDAGVTAALNSCIDLVAVATVADVMPLKDENRTLVKYGLRAINSGSRWQLRELAEGIELKLGEITARDIAFRIAPHINAAGRMGDADPVVNLMKTDDRDEAASIVAELIGRNAERRREQEEAVAACEELADREYPGDDVLLIRPPRVHEGVSGIVAGKIREKYDRPAIVFSRTEERGDSVLRGSARSIVGVDIISLIRRHEELLIRFGGHAMAAGFTMLAENEDALREALRADIRALARENPELFSQRVEKDADISPEEASIELARALTAFEPTGAGNPKPVLRIAAQTPGRLMRIGPNGRHMKFTAGGLEYVMFARGGKPAALPAESGPFDFYGSLEVNEWNDRERVQFILKEAICSESQS